MDTNEFNKVLAENEIQNHKKREMDIKTLGGELVERIPEYVKTQKESKELVDKEIRDRLKMAIKKEFWDTIQEHIKIQKELEERDLVASKYEPFNAIDCIVLINGERHAEAQGINFAVERDESCKGSLIDIFTDEAPKTLPNGTLELKFANVANKSLRLVLTDVEFGGYNFGVSINDLLINITHNFKAKKAEWISGN
jgi:hypothetical protein